MWLWIPLGLVLIFGPWYLSVKLGYFYFPLPDAAKGHAEFLNAASWVQAAVALCTFMIALFGLYQLAYLRSQNEIEKKRTEREVFRLTATPLIVSAKRFLYFPGVQVEFDKLLAL